MKSRRQPMKPRTTRQKSVENLTREPNPPSALLVDHVAAATPSFHVKQDPTPRGQSVARLRQAQYEVAQILLDTIYRLCEDGILETAQWESTMKDLELLTVEFADGTD